MKVLILARHIPPYNCVPGSTQRMVLFSRYLTERGHEVALVGSTRIRNKYKVPNWWDKELCKVNVLPLIPGRLLKYIDFIKVDLITKKLKKIELHIYQDKNSMLKDRNKTKTWFCKDILNKKIFYNLLRNIYNNMFLTGEDGTVEMPSLRKHLVKNLNEYNPNVVIVSAPPHSWLRIIPWLKHKYPLLPLIIDFRDGWTSRRTVRANNIFIRRCYQDYIERKVFSSTNGLVFTTPGMEKIYLAKYKKNLPYYEIIINGYNEKLWDKMNYKKINTKIFIKKHRPCVIKYIGSIDFNPKSLRSPYNIFLALESCLKKGIISRNDFILSFTGFINDIELLDDFPLLKQISRINSPVPPLDSLREMKTSDFLLLTDKKKDGAEEVLTGKLLDYVRAGKPIIAATTTNCGVKKFLENLGIGVYIDIENIEDISKKFIDIIKIFKSDSWDEWSRKNTISPLKIKEYSREFQYRKYEKFIERVISEKDI